MTETYQYNDWDYGNGELVNSYRYTYMYLYGNMIQRNQDYYLEGWNDDYMVVYTWEEATHDGGEVTGVEYYFESVGDMFSVFGDILESGGDGCVDCEGNLDNMSGYLLGHVDEALGGELTYDISEDALIAWEQNYGSFYFQFRDDNGNTMFDIGETYAVSLEDGPNGEMHVVSFEGFLYDLDFQMFWTEAYNFEFYPNDYETDEVWIFDGGGTPPGWELFQWGNASMGVTENMGMYEYSNALTFVQGDAWSGGGFNFPSLDIGNIWMEGGALMFWMWSDPNVPTLRLQFEDGVGKVGMHFEPVQERWMASIQFFV